MERKSQELDALRQKINAIDGELAQLFCERMEVSRQVADYKRRAGKPVYDPAREREIIARVAAGKEEPLAGYEAVLFRTLFDVSRSYQHTLLGGETAFGKELEQAFASPLRQFPKQAVVACQGVEGAYSQLAAGKLFSRPSIVYFLSLIHI